MGQPTPTYDGFKVDTWAVGITVHVLLRGEYPFDSLSDGLAQTENGTLSSELLRKLKKSVAVSPECTDFIKQCLTFDATARPTVQHLGTHAWLQGMVPPAVRPARMLAAAHCRYARADRSVRAGARRGGGRPCRDGCRQRRAAPPPAGPAVSKKLDVQQRCARISGPADSRIRSRVDAARGDAAPTLFLGFVSPP